MPRGCHWSVSAMSSMTIAARPLRATSRNFFGALELVAADVDRVAHGVVDPGDRDDVRGAVGADGRDPAELAAARQVAELGVPEDAQRDFASSSDCSSAAIRSGTGEGCSPSSSGMSIAWPLAFA